MRTKRDRSAAEADSLRRGEGSTYHSVGPRQHRAEASALRVDQSQIAARVFKMRARADAAACKSGSGRSWQASWQVNLDLAAAGRPFSVRADLEERALTEMSGRGQGLTRQSSDRQMKNRNVRCLQTRPQSAMSANDLLAISWLGPPKMPAGQEHRPCCAI